MATERLLPHAVAPEPIPVSVLHRYAVAETTTPGVYGTYCTACSDAAEDYVWPCRETWNTERVPQRLVAQEVADV